MEIYISLLILAAVWFFVYMICWLLRLDEKFGWSFGPLFLLMRTKWFNRFLERLAKKYARFWRAIGNISIVVGLLCMLVSIGLFAWTTIDFFLPKPVVNTTGSGTVGLIIPGITISFRTALYLIIPIILTMIPHEIAHGVVAHADKVELKSTGLLFFAVFFGAFVEPDEDSMLSSKAATKMRTYAVGIFPNLLLAFAVIPFFFFGSAMLNPLYEPVDGVLVIEVVDGTPAANSSISRGTAIYDINTTHVYNYSTFSRYMSYTKPNQTIVLNSSAGIVPIRLGTNPANESIGYLGIKTTDYRAPKYAFASKFFPNFFMQEIMWTLIISTGAVLLNALPLPIVTDGDKLLSTFLVRYVKKKRLVFIILSIFRFLALALFISSLVLPIVRNGFVPFG